MDLSAAEPPADPAEWRYKWGASLYGDPCRECGFRWSRTPHQAVGLVHEIPRLFADELTDATGRERHAKLAWTPTGYVCHVTDNLRIWAEALVGARVAGKTQFPGYEPDLLAGARNYDEVPLAGALWSLTWAVRAWEEELVQSLSESVHLQHPTRGVLRAEDVAGNNAHDAYHHVWDVDRIITAAQG